MFFNKNKPLQHYMKTLISLHLLLVLIYSCSTFQTLDKSVSDFVNNIDSKKSKMSSTEWEKADQKIEIFKQQFESSRYEMSEAQISSINKAFGRYAGLRIKSGILNLKESWDDFEDQLKGVADELLDTTQ
jgi:hypothetical protein